MPSPGAGLGGADLCPPFELLARHLNPRALESTRLRRLVDGKKNPLHKNHFDMPSWVETACIYTEAPPIYPV